MKKKISIASCKAGALVLVLALFMGAQVANADFTFGGPTNLGATVNSAFGDYDPHLSPNSLSLYFASNRPGGSGSDDLYVTTRDSATDPWRQPANLGPTINSSSYEDDPSLSMDELSLFFVSSRSGGSGNTDIWVATRLTRDDLWDRPVNLGLLVNSAYEEQDPSLSNNGLELYFSSNRPGGHGLYDIWIATRETVNADWGAPVNLAPTVNTSYSDHSPSISADGLTLFFCRGMSYLVTDLWAARRNTQDDAWGEPVNLGPVVNILGSNLDPDISADGLWLFWNSSDRPNNFSSWDLWQAPIIPIVDFNGDAIVDLKDFSKLAQHWGQNESSVDMGPTPLGDGVVDIQDVIVLAEYWLTDFRIVAHWKLDEEEGPIAHDSIAGKDAFGPPDLLWRPEDGKVGGALQLDGIDDLLFTTFSLNPADTSFSVFAWVKGSAPGQVIISQTGGANWLMADASAGKLMTELQGAGRFDGPLSSQAVITDGDWHRVGLTWDGSNRILYVDDVEVARDTQAGLAGSTGGLYFGAGKNPVPPSLWLGLLDDIRIYNRAVLP